MRLLTNLGMILVALSLSTAASAQVINGCIRANGVLKVVSAPEDCGTNETPISWNVQGPPGPATSLRVYDGSGAEIGILVDDQRTWDGRLLVFLESYDIVAPFLVYNGRISPEDSWENIYYTQPGCVGATYGKADAASRLVGDPAMGKLFAGGSTAEFDVSVESFTQGTTDCFAASTVLRVAVPVTEVTPADLGLTLPLPLPLYVAPAPEPAP